jgi:hypothetical protein
MSDLEVLASAKWDSHQNSSLLGDEFLKAELTVRTGDITEIRKRRL